MGEYGPWKRSPTHGFDSRCHSLRHSAPHGFAAVAKTTEVRHRTLAPDARAALGRTTDPQTAVVVLPELAGTRETEAVAPEEQTERVEAVERAASEDRVEPVESVEPVELLERVES